VSTYSIYIYIIYEASIFYKEVRFGK